jgi:1-acyl-sn-glycerol-3-phosphate acyltransferase
LQPGHAGVGLFADKIGADIVPVYVHGTFDAFSRHHTWPRPVRITVIFGPVLPLSAYANMPRGRERYQAIADDIMRTIAALRTQLMNSLQNGT